MFHWIVCFDTMNRFSMKKTALITGGSRGIGAAIVRRFKKAGLQVITPSRSELDLSSNKSIDAYFKKMSKSIDILVNNAGINRLGYLSELGEYDLADTLQVNLIAPAKIVSKVAPGMKEQKQGRIVNISSIFGIVTRERRLTYTSSKAGLIGLTRALAVELAPYNVLVNAVAPGYVETDLTKQNNSQEELRQISQTIPLKRLAQPEEIAEAVLFLCSENNTYITGHVLSIDGGFTCK
jgi:NAD(P)-dependent dehydrogenase (short-subunit alcohol dehydrogenase family)